MSPCNLEIFPLFSTFPISYIVRRFLKQFEYKVFHTRYQVPFCLWDIKLVWEFLKNIFRKYFEQNCSSLIWSSLCFTALHESLERSSNIPVRRHVISAAQLCLPKPLFCLNLLNYFTHIFFNPFLKLSPCPLCSLKLFQIACSNLYTVMLFLLLV